jgi:osmotically-inducible protein OsmY
MRWTRPFAGLLFAMALVRPAPALPAEGERAEREAPAPIQWTLEEEVEQRLAASRALAGSSIRAAANGEAIALRGSVRDSAQRQRAVHLAMRVAGAPVKDDLRLDGSAPIAGSVPDADLARAVAERLVASIVPDAKAERGWDFGWRIAGDRWSVDIDVDDGDVSLDGKVPLQQHIHALILAARDVPGVRSVRAQIGLVLPEAPKDELHP